MNYGLFVMTKEYHPGHRRNV